MSNEEKPFESEYCIEFNDHLAREKQLLFFSWFLALLILFVELSHLIVNLNHLLSGMIDDFERKGRNFIQLRVFQSGQTIRVFSIHLQIQYQVLVKSTNCLYIKPKYLYDFYVQFQNQIKFNNNQFYFMNNNKGSSMGINSRYISFNSKQSSNNSNFQSGVTFKPDRYQNPHTRFPDQYSSNIFTLKENTKTIDSIEIDYKEKSYELMRKNADLELNVKQSKSDVENLEKEVQRLTQVMKDVIAHFGNFRQSESQQILRQIGKGITNYEKNPNRRSRVFENFKNALNAQQHKQQGVRTPTKQSSSTNQSIYTSKLSSHSHSFLEQSSNNDNNQSRVEGYNRKITTSTFPIQPICYQEEQPCPQQCNCEEYFNQIIAQYKQIIDSQHKNLTQKQKINRRLKLEIEQYKNIIEQLKQTIARNEELSEQYQQKVKNYQKRNKKLQEEIEGQKQKIKKLPKVEQLDELTNQINELKLQLEEKQSNISELVKEKNQLGRQREKIKQKYKQQIVHFEEMEKLVEEKLIEVQYEMNFYKKERVENFEKIKNLQEQLKQYRLNEEKKYYSFGEESCKDMEIQVETNQLQEFEYQFSESKRNSRVKNEEMKMQCYQESIKVLLTQNSRLKEQLIKIYNRKNKQTGQIQLDQEIQFELKILSSIVKGEAEQPSSENFKTEDASNLEDESEGTESLQRERKGRKFIKQI